MLPAALLQAQNLNPTVEVTNVYASGANGIVKPVQEMAVPDSVTAFNLKLDYSVFDNPYKGAYEFTPYSVDVVPAVSAPASRVFYLRAGAGYTLHPEFEAVYSPVLWNKVRLDLFARNRSYFGPYRGRQTVDLYKGDATIRKVVWDRSRSYGYDSDTELGARALYAWKKGETFFSARWNNLSGQDWLATRSLNGVQLAAGVKSVGLERFGYDVKASWKHEGDYGGAVSPFSVVSDRADVRSLFTVPMQGAGELYARADFSLEALRGDLTGTAAMLWITPGYRFTAGNWKLDLGVLLDAFIGDRTRRSTQIVYPAVHASYTLSGGTMVAYADITGGSTFNPYSESVAKTHPFNAKWLPVVTGGKLMDNSLERVNASVGFRGEAWRRLQYDVRAGYARVANGRLEGLASLMQPAVGYADYHLAYAQADAAWISDTFKAGGRLSVQYAGVRDLMVFAPSVFTGNLYASYTWIDRITAGVTAEFATRRTAWVSDYEACRVPGWFDLGVFGEYAVNRMMSVWLKGGNLLNTTLFRVPLYTDGSGIWFSAGVVLTF